MATSAVLFLCLSSTAFAQENEESPSEQLPITGEAVEQFAAVEQWLIEHMREREIPGASLAIAVDGEIKLARGYGYADRDEKTPVAPDALFRIASISKPITAVAVLKLVDEGKLTLDDKVLDLLELRPNERLPDYDPWWDRITLRHLLTHTGGWDRERSGDPMFRDRPIVLWLDGQLPLTHHTLLEYQVRQPLDFAPGSRYAYSNFGYCLLGRVIEKATGKTYEQYVRDEVLAPVGITSARIGASRQAERCENEVCYYTIDGYESPSVVGPSFRRSVPGQYGGWNQELLDSHGGWIMSSPDLVRFGLALDAAGEGEVTRGGVLRSNTAAEMFTGQVPLRADAESNVPGYGLGWVVTRLDDTPVVMHNGALPCTASVLARLDDRIWFAVLMNLGRTRDGQWISSGLERELGRRILAATQKE